MRKWGQSPIFDQNDTGQKSRKLRLLANIAAALVVGTGWYYSVRTSKPVDGSGKVSASELREEFQKIPAPKDVSAVEGLVVNAKSSSILVEHRYATQPSSFNLILDYYDHQLKSNGWLYSGHYAGGSNGGEIYCKGLYEANLEFMPLDVTGNLTYVFSMTWSDVSVSQCSAKSQHAG